MALKKQSRNYKSFRRPPIPFAEDQTGIAGALYSTHRPYYYTVDYIIQSQVLHAGFCIEVVLSSLYRCYALVLVFSSCVIYSNELNGGELAAHATTNCDPSSGRSRAAELIRFIEQSFTARRYSGAVLAVVVSVRPSVRPSVGLSGIV